ncbi:unnamed protein product [Acanthoscelides obtectus]|uniref:C2H2-type domain-containing protein n=1 Tax=Acanthoscelides obtectus TaxID=200917 RepID=A0A9P0LDX3_ACAOB|nr:unnamed protein product [Acanthoscelides obtectus]CAK1688812.1 Zinc finger protein 746 [Acanthoscelides obtectus]
MNLSTLTTIILHSCRMELLRQRKRKRRNLRRKRSPDQSQNVNMLIQRKSFWNNTWWAIRWREGSSCDICGAGLKRKDHLTRHKQSHNPERPYVCTVCLKAFKRKEQLTLHFVIHSGEKRHVCTECGKGFYRKDHLRKHTRSHIARRVKAELSQQGCAEIL